MKKKKIFLFLVGAIVAAFLPLVGYYVWEYFHQPRFPLYRRD